MNKRKFKQLEHKRLLQVAREYERKGYRVQTEPSGFPPFLQRERPDLVATSEDDNVVVEIVSEESIGDPRRLESLAKSVEVVPGWRFELVVTNPQEQPAEDIPLEEMESRLQQARHLDEQGMLVPALLTGWSATEALLRQVAAIEGVESKRLASLRLVKTMYSLGVLTRSEYELLEKAVQARNAAAHGLQPTDGVPVDQVLPGFLDMADRLLRRILPSDRIPKREHTAEELVRWFFENYEDPANGVPYEGGYVYIFGGPYDAWDELSAEFPDAGEDVIQEAVDTITTEGVEWIRRGQY